MARCGPLVGFEDAGQDFQKGRFAGTRRPHDDGDLSPRHREADIFQYPVRLPVGKPKPFGTKGKFVAVGPVHRRSVYLSPTSFR